MKRKGMVIGKTTALEVARAAEDWSRALVDLREKRKLKNNDVDDIAADLDIEYCVLLAKTEYVRRKRDLLDMVNDWVAGGYED